jgi:hypothetical protein
VDTFKPDEKSVLLEKSEIEDIFVKIPQIFGVPNDEAERQKA